MWERDTVDLRDRYWWDQSEQNIGEWPLFVSSYEKSGPGTLWLCNSRSKVKANRCYLFWLLLRFWTLFWNTFCEIRGVKIILFLPATKKRSNTLSFNHCKMEIASSIPWKATKIRARHTKRKKSEASTFKQFSQRLLDNEVFRNSLKILLWQKPKHPSSSIYTQQVGIWDIVQILPVGITETSFSAFNSDYPALQSKI